METSKTITQRRYSLGDALVSVPCKDVVRVRKEVMSILNIKSRKQLDRISKGESMPSLAQAKAVEEYFLKEWKMKDVWKEIRD